MRRKISGGDIKRHLAKRRQLEADLKDKNAEIRNKKKQKLSCVDETAEKEELKRQLQISQDECAIATQLRKQLLQQIKDCRAEDSMLDNDEDGEIVSEEEDEDIE
mmetsp:Transcript_15436/g.25706  ORF Transcript_15436/g.25706 Transcript_15436/m.25706 type:complete len:105 (-) Transcript_15436:59-373(-)